jgi:hypothetical protein
MPADRFRFIEGKNGPLPEDLKKTLGNLGRFTNIELPGSLPPKPKETGKACPGCDSPNAPGALECKACHRVLEPEPKVIPHGADLAIVLDGQTYKSTDPGLPEDIKVLITQIRKSGYTPKLVADWRSWRATRRSAKAKAVPQPSGPIPVLRINGRLLRWSDSDLPDDLRVLFSFIATNGVSAGLLNHLGELGYEAAYDPKAEGGLGLLNVRTNAAQSLTGLQKAGVRFLLGAGLAALILFPLRNILPEMLQPVVYLLPLGMGISWAARR